MALREVKIGESTETSHPVVFQPRAGRRLAPKWDPNGTRIGRLQVILKTVERCNINCSYCYYFNDGDQSFKERPPTMSARHIPALVSFLQEGAAAFGIDTVQLVFHGGEPTMQKKRDFAQYCIALRSAFAGSLTRLELSIQTNGTLIDQEWLELFHQFGVTVGVSLDGPQG